MNPLALVARGCRGRGTGRCVASAMLRRAACTARPAAPMRRRLCTVAAEAAAKPAEAEGGLGWLMRAGQVDAGFFQGSALFAGVIIGIQVSSEQQRAAVLDSLIAGYRAFGLSEEHVSDRQLIEDFVRKNVAAAANVVMASPVFYFMFAKVMKESILVSSVRAITGTFRIVPFMGFFYGAFALISPFLVDFFMGRGQSYAEANGTSGIVMILSGFVLIEAVVELRGCGVLFSQMTASSFFIFVPALVGRLATGVLTQQQKTGQEDGGCILPESWQEGSTGQQHTYQLFERLHIDNDFAVTSFGTSVFQYILNAVTFVLLTKGKATGLKDIAAFIAFGMEGSLLSGIAQFGKTLFMRSCFGFAWNLASSQPVDMPAFDAKLDKLPPHPTA